MIMVGVSVCVVGVESIEPAANQERAALRLPRRTGTPPPPLQPRSSLAETSALARWLTGLAVAVEGVLLPAAE